VPKDSRQETPPPLWQKWFLPLIPALLAIAVFIPILGNGFVNWDDPLYVYNNLHIRHLDLRWIFTAVVASNYHPLTLLSHTLDYRLFGLNPAGHHLTSLILHALNSALVFLLAKRLLGGSIEKGKSPVPAAMIAALLFAVHPLHVESVAWVSERKDVLSAFFFLLAILAYLPYAKAGNKKFYGLTLLAFILALLSKPMAITLPAVLLILDYYPLKRLNKAWKKLLIEKIPFFTISLASAIITVWAQKAGGGLRGLETHSISTRLYIAARALIFYLYKLILPVNLSPYYPLPFNTRLLSPRFIFSLIFIVIITILCLYAAKNRRWPLALWAFYLVTLAPVSGLVTVGGQAVADRYAYIPTMGFFILAGAAIQRIAQKNDGNGTRPVIWAVPILIIALLGLQTIRQTAVWQNSVTLMSRAINLYPNRAAISYNNRGLAYDKKGKLRLALTDYNRAIAISPEFTEAYINRGIIYGESSLFDKAIKDFSEAISLDPSSAKAYMNRGAAYMSEGDYKSALRDLRQVRTLNPKDAATHFNLGLVYFNIGNKIEALKSMKKAAALGLPEAREFISREGLY